jgi:hypothetical protein
VFLAFMTGLSLAFVQAGRAFGSVEWSIWLVLVGVGLFLILRTSRSARSPNDATQGQHSA